MQSSEPAWETVLHRAITLARDAGAELLLEHGKQDPALEWVRIDAFPRETLWEGRAEREAWERAANPRKG